MLPRSLLLLILLPLVELFLLVWLASETSVLAALALVIGTGVLGAALARRQGWRAWQKIQQHLAQGRAPAAELVDGLLILVAGLLLVLPGIITDCVGAALLIPPVRAIVRSVLSRRLRVQSRFDFHEAGRFTQPPSTENGDNVIDVEFSRSGSSQATNHDRRLSNRRD